MGTSYDALPKHIHIRPNKQITALTGGDNNDPRLYQANQVYAPEVQPTEVEDSLDNILSDQRNGFHSQADSHRAILSLIADREAKAVAEALKGQVFNEVTISEKVHIPKQLLAEIKRKAAVSLCGELYELIGNEIDAGVPEEVAWRTVISQTKTDLIAQYERGEYGKN